MTIDDKTRDEKLQYHINKETAKTSAVSSRQMDKYEHLVGEKILPSNQSQIIEYAKFTYCSFQEVSEKQKKKQVDESIFQRHQLNYVIIDKLNKTNYKML